MPDIRQPRRRKAKLLDQIRAAIRLRGYTQATEKSYVYWIKRYIYHHGKQHPAALEAVHIRDFLSSLVVEKNVSSSTQNLALNAVIFLYKEVLHAEAGDVGTFVRAKRPKRLPVVLTRREVGALLDHMQSTPGLVASMMYGSGLRLGEAVRLRVKDVDLEARSITVRRGKPNKDGLTMWRIPSSFRFRLTLCEFRRCTARTSPPDSARPRSPVHWHENTSRRQPPSTGSMYFQAEFARGIVVQDGFAAITYRRPRFRRR